MAISKVNILTPYSVQKLASALFESMSTKIDSHIIQELTDAATAKQVPSAILVKNILETLQSKQDELTSNLDSITDSISGSVTESLNAIKSELGNTESTVIDNGKSIDTLTGTVATIAEDVAAENTRIDEVSSSAGTNTTLIANLNKSIDTVSSTVAGFDHVAIQIVIGDINQVQDPKENVLYFQKDDAQDLTWVLYLYSEDYDDHWLPVGDTKLDLGDYWSKDDIEEMKTALGIEDNVETMTIDDVTALIDQQFKNYMDGVFIITAYADEACTKPISAESPLQLNVFETFDGKLYFNIEYFAANQIDDVEIGVNDIFASVDKLEAKGGLLTTTFAVKNLGEATPGAGLLPVEFNASNFIRTVNVNYNLKADAGEIIESLGSLAGTTSYADFNKIYAGKGINEASIELGLNSDYTGTVGVAFKTDNEQLSKVPVTLDPNVFDNVCTLMFDNDKIGELAAGSYDATLEFTFSVSGKADVIMSKSISVEVIDLDETVKIVDGNGSAVELVSLPVGQSVSVTLRKLFLEGLTELKDLTTITNVDVTPVGEEGVSAVVNVTNTGTDYATITLSKSESNDYGSSYPMQVKIDFSINGVNFEFYKMIDVSVETSPESYFAMDSNDGVITGLANTGDDPATIVIPSTIGGVQVTSIGDEAFLYNASLESVTIPEGVTSIGNGSFQNCESLTSVTIPSSVKTIGDNAFSYCTALGSIEIPEGVETIGENAFSGCTVLTDVGIPSSATTIGAASFENCMELVSIEIPNGVEAIAPGILAGCNKLPSINIPEGVTSIGEAAFQGCAALTSIEIPESVESIGTSAFYECTSLESVTIPEGITTIDYNLFLNCTSLESISIPSSVTSIASYAFSGCTALTDVYYGGTPSQWNAISFGMNIDPLLNAKKHYPPSPDSYFVFNAATNSITGLTDAGKAATEIVIPSTIGGVAVTGIGNNVFQGCTALTIVEIPESVTKIGGYAFSGCTALTSIVIPEGVTTISNNVFEGCTNLASVTIPSSVISISGAAFKNCKALTAITIPEGVTKIYGNAFNGCTSLASVNLPSSLVEILFNAFTDCTSLTSIVIPEGVKNIENYTFQGCAALRSIAIPKGIKTIGSSAFSYCVALASVTIPESVKTIYSKAFYYCTALTDVYYGGNEEQWNAVTIEDKNDPLLNATKHYMASPVSYFVFDSATGNITGLTDAGKAATEIVIPSTIGGVAVTGIGNDVFKGCTNLTSATIPSGVTSIGSSAFNGCTKLASVTIPDGVTSIANVAFFGCTSLTSVIIPESVTEIGGYAFKNCTALKSVNIPSGVTTIGDNIFNGCKALTSVTISEGVTTIASSAFQGCSSLTSIVIPEGVETISTSAFQDCTGLTSVTIPSSVRSIAAAFSGCTGLKSVNISKGVETIGANLFRGCTSLTSVIIPESVTFVNYYAFTDCTALTDVYYGGNEEQWNAITMNPGNEKLTNATKHYNSAA